jgi:regulator of replication initiation timing
MTFDLEKARKLTYRAPPGATGHGSDLNKHREWQAVVEICDKRYPEALDQITDLMQNCNSLRARAQKAEAEIERLRAELASATMTTYALATEYQQEMAKSWQITDEKRDAIEKAAHICHEVTAFDVAAALRAMLTEAE